MKEIKDVEIQDLTISVNNLKNLIDRNYNLSCAFSDEMPPTPAYLCLKNKVIAEGTNINNPNHKLKFVGFPNDYFWSLWNYNKQGIKDLNILCEKDDVYYIVVYE